MDSKKIVKFFSTEIKSVDTENRIVDAIVSTKKVDRDGDVIMPDAFSKRIKVYKDHPVLLSSHSYYNLKSQIGEAVGVKITDAGLEVKFKYYTGEGNDQADWGFNLAQKGIAAFSIGFMGMEYEWIKEKDKDGVERVTGRKYTDVELLEISQVLVPSNRGALQSSRSMIAAETEVYELAAKAFGDGTLADVEPKEAPVVPDLCKCEILEMKGVDEIKSGEGMEARTDFNCGTCKKKVADDKVAAVKNFINAISGKHYTEAILPPGADGSIPEAKDTASAVREAFQDINNKK